MSKKWLALTLKFLVSGFLIWFLLSKLDLDEALTRLTQIEPAMLAGALGVILVQIVIGGLRWWAVQDAIDASLGVFKSIRFFYIGVFFSQVLPSAVGGDAVRMYKAYRQGIPLGSAVNGVLLERVVTVVTLVLVVVATQPWFLGRVDEATRAVILPGLVLVVVGAVAGMAFLMMLDRLPESLMRWRLVRGLGNLGGDARRLFLSLGRLWRAFGLGVLTHINMSVCVFLLAMGLDLDVTWLDCLVLVPLVLLIMTIPISIGGWGVRETAMVTLFGLVGAPAEGALVMSVVFGLVGMAAAIPGGLVWLASRDRGETLDYPPLDPALDPGEGNGADRESAPVSSDGVNG